jgi:hypothetical protein
MVSPVSGTKVPPFWHKLSKRKKARRFAPPGLESAENFEAGWLQNNQYDLCGHSTTGVGGTPDATTRTGPHVLHDFAFIAEWRSICQQAAPGTL